MAACANHCWARRTPVMAEGGLAAAMANVDKADDWRTHFRDTMRGGKLLNNWRMAQLHAQEAPDRVRELEQWGALFDRTENGEILQRAFGGHTFKRLCHVGDRTGLEMIRTSAGPRRRAGLRRFHGVHDHPAAQRRRPRGGAFGYWRENGSFVMFKAKSIVIATGGIGKSWKITSNSWECTGDGMALAYEAGAELLDMEFVQFHPTGMVWPPGVQGLLVTEAVRGEGGILRNKNGERFMEKYDPKRMELSTRDVVPRSIYTEVKEGRGTARRRVPRHFAQAGRIREAEAAQHVPPVQGTGGRGHHEGAHGSRADLPLHDGRNSRGGGDGAIVGSGTICRGRGGRWIAWRESPGRELALGFAGVWQARGIGRGEDAKKVGAARLDSGQIEQAERQILAPFQRTGGENPYKIHDDLQEVMQTLVGIFRTDEDLRKALVEIEKLKERAKRTHCLA